MTFRYIWPLAALLAATLSPGLVGCRTTNSDTNAPVALATAGGVTTDTSIEPGITFREVDQTNETGTLTHLWVYLPTNANGNAKGKIPCIVIGAAGTPLIWGRDLGEDDRPEHLPYARAGYAVVAYSVEGSVPDDASNAINPTMLAGIAAFRKAEAGVSDTRAAIDYALKLLPQVDPNRLYAVGHSSAATIALLAAENDTRIKACVAYAPITDNLRRESELAIHFRDVVPDIAQFLTDSSPITHAEKLHCPLFLFHADDDPASTANQVVDFRVKVAATNPHVTYVAVSSGGHYQSMIDEGIPRGIAWLQTLSAKGG